MLRELCPHCLEIECECGLPLTLNVPEPDAFVWNLLRRDVPELDLAEALANYTDDELTVFVRYFHTATGPFQRIASGEWNFCVIDGEFRLRGNDPKPWFWNKNGAWSVSP